MKGNPHRQKLLENLGFQWKAGNASLGWLEVLHKAAIYSKLHQRKLDIPYGFVVPRPPPDSKPHVDSVTAADNENEVWPWPGTYQRKGSTLLECVLTLLFASYIDGALTLSILPFFCYRILVGATSRSALERCPTEG